MKKILTAVLCIATLAVPAVASAATSTVTRSDGYTVTMTGPTTGKVGTASGYTATCGYPSSMGPCPYGDFRMFGGTINRLGEGFGQGAMGFYTFRAPGFYSARYRLGANCIGSTRQACPIDVFINGIAVTA